MADPHRDMPCGHSHRGDQMKIYAVHDIKAESYLQPFFAGTDGLAIRMFQAAANDQEHQFWKYAEDYSLYRIGEWDESTGVVHAAAKTPLGSALQYREDINPMNLDHDTAEGYEQAIEELKTQGEEWRLKALNNGEVPQKSPKSS